MKLKSNKVHKSTYCSLILARHLGWISFVPGDAFDTSSSSLIWRAGSPVRHVKPSKYLDIKDHEVWQSWLHGPVHFAKHMHVGNTWRVPSAVASSKTCSPPSKHTKLIDALVHAFQKGPFMISSSASSDDSFCGLPGAVESSLQKQSE